MPAKDLPLEVPDCPFADAPLPGGVFDSLVLIRVGQRAEKRKFQVHCGLLRHHSIYFSDALRRSGSHIDLHNDSPEIFENVVYWMYTRQFYASGTSEDGLIPLAWSAILSIYSFAQDKGMQELQNASITLFYQKLMQTRSVSPSCIPAIYRFAESPFQKLFVFHIARTQKFTDIKRFKRYFNVNFCLDLLREFESAGLTLGSDYDHQKLIRETKTILCQNYHVHTNETG